MNPEKQAQHLRSSLRGKVFNVSKYNPDGFFLNIHHLPTLMKYILTHLTEEEQRSIVAYETQNLLLEIAAKGVEDPKLSTLEELVEYVVEFIRAKSSYWERYSNPWHDLQALNKPDLLDDYERKEAQAINSYNLQISKLEQACDATQKRQFKVKRDRIIPQNYDLYNHFGQSKSSERLDTSLLPYLKQFCMSKTPTLHGQTFEYFLLDCCLSSEPRRRRKSNALDDMPEQESVQQFRKFMDDSKLKLDDYLLDQLKELEVIANIVKASRLFTTTTAQIATAHKPPTQFDIGSVIEQALQPQLLQEHISTWLNTYAKQLSAVQGIDRREDDGNLSLRGCLNTTQQIDAILQEWDELFNCEQMEKINKYKYNLAEKINWTDQQYRLFLQGLIAYNHISVNNKKIAAFMGKDVQPNHVKYVKGEYLRNIRIRRGTQSKISVMKSDLESFSVKVFQKPRLPKTKKYKKKANEDGMNDDDSSYN